MTTIELMAELIAMINIIQKLREEEQRKILYMIKGATLVAKG